MFALITAILFSIISIFTVLLILGFPLGEFTMGGQDKILPLKFRIMALFMLFIQIFAIVIVLQAGGYIPLWFSEKTTRIICFVFAAYMSLNTVMNLFSNSKKEKYTMSPMSFLSAICFWVTAFRM